GQDADRAQGRERAGREAVTCGHREPPFLRGIVLADRRQVSWLPGRPPRLPEAPCASVADPQVSRRRFARSQWRDRAGFAPDFPWPPAVCTRASLNPECRE